MGATPRGGKRHGDSAMVTAPWRCHSALITARGDGAGGDRTRGGSAGAAARRHQGGAGSAGPRASRPRVPSTWKSLSFLPLWFGFTGRVHRGHLTAPTAIVRSLVLAILRPNSVFRRYLISASPRHREPVRRARAAALRVSGIISVSRCVSAVKPTFGDRSRAGRSVSAPCLTWVMSRSANVPIWVHWPRIKRDSNTQPKWGHCVQGQSTHTHHLASGKRGGTRGATSTSRG